MGAFRKCKHLLQVAVSVFKEKNIVPVVERVNNEDLLAEKVALITGGSGGIGLTIAKKLLMSGCKVIIAGTNEEKLKKCCVESGIEKYIVLDMNQVNLFQTKIDEAAQYYGKIDILVHSAGIHTNREGFDFINVTELEYDDVMAVNLKGSFFLCQAIGNYMITNKIKGHILMVSSQKALEPSWSPYRLSKLGLEGLTKGVAQKLSPFGITVNAIGPGPTATGMVEMGVNGSIYTNENVLERYILPEEVAEYALLLVSDLGKLLLGNTLYVTAGQGIINDN